MTSFASILTDHKHYAIISLSLPVIHSFISIQQRINPQFGSSGFYFLISDFQSVFSTHSFKLFVRMDFIFSFQIFNPFFRRIHSSYSFVWILFSHFRFSIHFFDAFIQVIRSSGFYFLISDFQSIFSTHSFKLLVQMDFLSHFRFQIRFFDPFVQVIG